MVRNRGGIRETTLERINSVSYPRRGETYLVRLPGHPADPKARPALIVSMDVRNRLANDCGARFHHPAPGPHPCQTSGW